MESSNNRLIFLVLFLIFAALTFTYYVGLTEGYQQGQIDALQGKFKYAADTTKVVNFIKK